jgi:hypothetical protein
VSAALSEWLVPSPAPEPACEDATAIIENARARAVRDARVMRGERVAGVDPPYPGRSVLRIARKP